MINTGKLAGKTVFITGASRGIGKAIALKAARDGANIVIAAKTAQEHAKLPGTIYSVAQEVESAGGKCLPCIVDVREEDQIAKAVEGAVQKFGGIDVLVNNASAIHLTGTLETPMKRYDLMHNVNTRGTFLTSKHCIPHLKKSSNPHILNLSPPLIMSSKWFKDHVAYTMAKYGMSMCVLGMAEEFRADGIAVNGLWPKTAIYTAAMEMLGGKDISKSCRKPDIIADAAYYILSKDSKTCTGNFFIDERVLKEAGITNFDQYAVEPGNDLVTDFFLSEEDLKDAANLISVPSSSPAKGGETNTTAGGTPDNLDAVFLKVKDLITEDLVKQTSAIYSFQVKGAQEGTYFIDLKNASGSAGKGEPSEKADVVFTTDAETYTKMFSGTLKPTAAFMSGKLRMKGDMGRAMKLEKLMSKLKSKL